MKSLKEQLDSYALNHQAKHRILAHYIGTPALMIGSLILLSWFSISIAGYWHITFAWAAVALALFYYFRLHVKLAAAMTAVLIILTLICTWIAYPSPNIFNSILLIVLLLGGAVLQFSGQLLAKQPLSYRSTLQQLTIAPIYLLTEILKLLKLEKYFDLAEVEQQNNPES